jgi:hypothetical protein
MSSSFPKLKRIILYPGRVMLSLEEFNEGSKTGKIIRWEPLRYL